MPALPHAFFMDVDTPLVMTSLKKENKWMRTNEQSSQLKPLYMRDMVWDADVPKQTPKGNVIFFFSRRKKSISSVIH